MAPAVRREPRNGHEELARSRLGEAAGALQRLWAEAISHGDFVDVIRYTDASHAVQRALLALDPNGKVAERN